MVCEDVHLENTILWLSSLLRFMMFIQAFARIENHYFVNKGFFPTDSFLLDNVEKIKHINTVIVQVYHPFVASSVILFMSCTSNDVNK